MDRDERVIDEQTFEKSQLGINATTGLSMSYESGQIDGLGRHDGMQGSVMVGGAEVDGIAGVLWDAVGTCAIAPRDSDVIYRLYRHEDPPDTDGDARPMRGRCFISEPQRPYVLGDRLVLETRDGQRIFGSVRQIREMRTGSVSLILDIE
jgi:hypothetical protein